MIFISPSNANRVYMYTVQEYIYTNVFCDEYLQNLESYVATAS